MEGNSLNSFENLCKIFETRIKLDKEKNIETPPDVLINYEKYSKKIDSIYNSKFEKEIKPLARKMDEEEKRLEEESHELQKGAESARNEYYKQRDIENRKIELNKKNKLYKQLILKFFLCMVIKQHF